ncbi:MAG: 2-dehydro-3-deoxygalactonokinase [Verrucomicrobiales bacterium]|nr:2-dehydro-3-deoxygalactonokinase [Verrucomicrobiales bacterium]
MILISPFTFGEEKSGPLIAVDWGSTNLRACLLINAAVVEQIETGDGIKNIPNGNFESVLGEHTADWRNKHSDCRFLLSGMIGSREGWVEVPYVQTPAGLSEIRAGLHRFESPELGHIAIVPGISHENPDGTIDVMRGEESQVLELLADTGRGNAIICLPGTHSKWIECRDGRIVRFRTWVTGEAFELLSSSPLLAKGDAPDCHSKAFGRGIELARKSESGLLHQLFLGRTEMLMGRVPAADLPSLLSGLLISTELCEAEIWLGENASREAFLPVGPSQLIDCYQVVIQHFKQKAD